MCGPDSDATNQSELIRPVKGIRFRGTENVQLSHLFLLGRRIVLRVDLHISRAGFLGCCPTLLSLRLRRFGDLLAYIFYCLATIVVPKRLAFPFVVRGRRRLSLLPDLANVGLLGDLLALPVCG